MSFYISITAAQSPFDLGADENDRVMIVCNYNAQAHYPVDKFEEEVARVIFDAGLGALATDLFIGSKANLPTSGVGPFTTIIRTTGYPPLETHDDSKYENLSCQITVRSTNYATARARAVAIWRVLDGLRNTTVTAA